MVIVVPMGVLKTNLLHFEPRLPEWKEEAIANLGVGNENKIALFFESVLAQCEVSWGCCPNFIWL